MKKILITGGSGFIGKHLISELSKNDQYEILNIDLVHSNQNCEFREVDIRNDLDKVFEDFRPNYVINLAAETSVKPQKIDDFTTNIQGVENLVNAINKFQVEKSLFFSTQYVYQSYGNNWEGYDVYKPFTVYGESKKIGEEIVINSCKRPYLLLRPTNVWGEENEVYINGLFKVMDKGYYYHPNKKNVLRSYGYIKNLCFQTIKLLESEQADNVYYLSDRPVNLFEFVNSLNLEINNKPIKTLPYLVFKVAALVGDLAKLLGVGFPMNSVRLTNMVSPNPVPIEDTISITGEAPYGLEESIKRTIEWYKKL